MIGMMRVSHAALNHCARCFESSLLQLAAIIEAKLRPHSREHAVGSRLNHRARSSGESGDVGGEEGRRATGKCPYMDLVDYRERGDIKHCKHQIYEQMRQFVLSARLGSHQAQISVALSSGGCK